MSSPAHVAASKPLRDQHVAASLLLLVLAVPRVTATRPDPLPLLAQDSPADDGAMSFEGFKVAFQKSYSSLAEEARRAKIFEANLELIQRENSVANK
eukprot:CAMPEP_0197862678 /NCGR_PEP_ID=MMETSP1438-20131217/39644_1 /TAXON_ID=1461541 /ORGANISM="Pterosperma sp., Strain CCMP1384" /LENGTH=96 /DNA_ID=CAMNT_0043480325 /DNA_START=22 /DNA_END=309 /DNA_ORIENTATION=-